MTWIHSCVAIDSALNHLTVVVNGKKLEDKAFPIPAGEEPPSSLTEKLLIFKGSIGKLSWKKKVKKTDIVCTGGGGVNPSSLIKPKFTGFLNHPGMDSRHHNMSAMPQDWLG